MKLLPALAIGVLCASSIAAIASRTADASGDEDSLLQADRTAFGSGSFSITRKDNVLDSNFTWTDSSGITRNKSQILREFHSGKQFPIDVEGGNGQVASVLKAATTVAHSYGQIGLIQVNSGKIYSLRVWVKRDASWRLLIYQSVSIGAPPSAEASRGVCENPCNAVPFHPRNDDERDVIHTYQAVERAVTAHDSAAWGTHIAGEFFAVTSNSDHPLDKTTRMAGLDNQKVAGIAPYPLVSARMFEFGDAMVMTSRQQPERGLPLHVTRVWFKRNGAWIEAYSYQTTIQPAVSSR